jgi:uncharacterized protein YndB with AHSA1/START domain
MLPIMHILTILLIVVAALLVYAAVRPNSFRVQRAIAIKAPAERIFAQINDFHNWPAWSPYEKLDPAMTRKLSGAEAGQGAVYEWSGNSKAGQGRMEITATTPPSQIDIKLDFTRPFVAHNRVTFAMKAAGDSTATSWIMEGPSPYMAKLMGIFMNMDKLVGRDFERGLANLKAIAESGQ